MENHELVTDETNEKELNKMIDYFYRPIHAEGIKPRERFNSIRRFEAFLDEASQTFKERSFSDQYRLAAFDYTWFRENPRLAKTILVDCVLATQRCISKSLGYQPEAPTVKTA